MRYQRVFSVLILFVSLFVSALANAAPITNLRTSVSPARVRIVLDSKEPIQYKVEKDKLRLEITLPLSTAAKQQAKLKDDAIKAVRLLPEGQASSKLLVDLNKECQYKYHINLLNYYIQHNVKESYVIHNIERHKT